MPFYIQSKKWLLRQKNTVWLTCNMQWHDPLINFSGEPVISGVMRNSDWWQDVGDIWLTFANAEQLLRATTNRCEGSVRGAHVTVMSSACKTCQRIYGTVSLFYMFCLQAHNGYNKITMEKKVSAVSVSLFYTLVVIVDYMKEWAVKYWCRSY